VLLHYVAKRRNAKIAHSNAAIMHCRIQPWSLLDFFNLFDSRLTLTLPYDSLNLVISVFSSGLLGEHGSGERKSTALQQLDCVAHKCTGELSSGFLLSQGNAEALGR